MNKNLLFSGLMGCGLLLGRIEALAKQCWKTADGGFHGAVFCSEDSFQPTKKVHLDLVEVVEVVEADEDTLFDAKGISEVALAEEIL